MRSADISIVGVFKTTFGTRSPDQSAPSHFPLCRAKVQQAFVYNEGRELDWQSAADACRFNILFANLVICVLANAKIQEGTARFFANNTELWRRRRGLIRGAPGCQSTSRRRWQLSTHLSLASPEVNLQGSDPAVRRGLEAAPCVRTAHLLLLLGHHETVVHFALQK